MVYNHDSEKQSVALWEMEAELSDFQVSRKPRSMRRSTTRTTPRAHGRTSRQKGRESSVKFYPYDFEIFGIVIFDIYGGPM